jgi:hypothetical protein
MQNKPGPRKKPGERYPSGDLKPVVAPALWGKARDHGDPQLSSELARLCFRQELTETQAEAGFLIADICRCSDSVAVTRKSRPRSGAQSLGGLDAKTSTWPRGWVTGRAFNL